MAASLVIALTGGVDAMATPPAVDGLIAFWSERDGNGEIYVMKAAGAKQTRLTNDPAYDAQLAWSPDGTKLAFTRDEGSASPTSS